MDDINSSDEADETSEEICDVIGCQQIGTINIECCGCSICDKHYKKLVKFCNTCNDECCKDCVVLNKGELGFICEICNNFYCEICVDDNKHCKCTE